MCPPHYYHTASVDRGRGRSSLQNPEVASTSSPAASKGEQLKIGLNAENYPVSDVVPNTNLARF